MAGDYNIGDYLRLHNNGVIPGHATTTSGSVIGDTCSTISNVPLTNYPYVQYGQYPTELDQLLSSVPAEHKESFKKSIKKILKMYLTSSKKKELLDILEILKSEILRRDETFAEYMDNEIGNVLRLLTISFTEDRGEEK